ncbi:MAG TPA: hypothetical protein ENN90_07680 [Mariniphaga anaerophila]|uniref:Threonine/homoserine/homoserine lactone efflux protein n=1 Tax=Mariniphaga anaerophila TaxID=1484053 RepID=A0A831PJ84_9BACT|nr:hypothetical protein [Mariniphaga anaerophila]
MELNSAVYLLIAIAATIIGAVPFGLVNLSMVNVALKNDSHGAVQIAHGASVVEVIFALAALLTGAKLSPVLEGNPVVRYFVFAVLLGSGLFFWFKKNREKTKPDNRKSSGFFKGIILNLVSIQVLLFWLLAATVLSAKQLIPSVFSEMLFFVAGVWLAKMAVLWAYAFLAKKVVSHAQKISSHINRIIGVVLMVVAVVQLFKI